ncbi:t9ss c-terminal target domain-containing protein [Gigaspora margarita]|uniref:T9ss c-terminal target domain-containing protein n=1 Tax=Gigaspora margarita TaxID=4874 RepID=A0A8H4B2U9_GIGMA|nr:t9ss c-terminal target domain-containing protein [Gigaspora margarita]
MLQFKGKRPYLVINHLGRSKIDVNRPINEGHGHPEHFIEIGYVLSAETLSLSTSQINEDSEIYSGSSIRALYTRNLNNIQFANLLYSKTTSLGNRLQPNGYDAVPSHIHKHPLKDEKYFPGGYYVQKYGSRCAEHVIDAIQIE